MSRRARWALAGGALLVAAALLAPAAADWLVTRDGARIETVGPWRVESRLVTFQRPDGTYASLRLSEVDLEASERLTRELAERARAPRTEPEPEPRPVIARLTEKELPPVAPGEARPAAGAEAGSNAGGEEGSAAPEALQVVNWREVGGPAGTGLAFVGDLRNTTERTALNAAVTVVLFDQEGEETASAEALLTTSALAPGRTAGFRATFPGVFAYAGVEFRASADLVLSGGEERPGQNSPPAPENTGPPPR